MVPLFHFQSQYSMPGGLRGAFLDDQDTQMQCSSSENNKSRLTSRSDYFKIISRIVYIKIDYAF